MFATHFFESRILNTFNNVTATGFGNLFAGLYFSNPGNTGQGGIEVNYTGYARQPVTFTVPYAESGGIGIRSISDILWAAAPSDVGQARYIGIMDSATIGSGNMLLYSELSIPLDIRTSQQPSIYAGDILFFSVGDFSIDFKTRTLNVIRGQNLPGFTPHLALFDGDPEATGVELTGGAYARVSIDFSAPAIQVGGQSQIQNLSLLRFPSPTTTWGNWAFHGIRDAAVGGGLILKIANPVPEVIHRNYVPQIQIGECRVALN